MIYKLALMHNYAKKNAFQQVLKLLKKIIVFLYLRF